MQLRNNESSDRAFPLLLVHFGFALTGIGTTLLGPVLPVLSAHWILRDAQAGTLILLQFIGSSLGAIVVSRNLRKSLLMGYLCSAAGLVLLVHSGYYEAFVSLFLFGLGLGLSMTATNLIIGRQYAERRAAALSLVNFSWSAGAMLSPLIAGWSLSHSTLGHLLWGLCAAFLTVWLLLFFKLSRPGLSYAAALRQEDEAGSAGAKGAPLQVICFFAALLFLYVGVENCINGWLTTYALRFVRLDFMASAATTSLFWVALTVGRGIDSLLLKVISESTMQRYTLLASVVGIAGLLRVHSAPGIVFFSVWVGLALAPVFPVGLSLFLGGKPLPRQAGIVLALSGTGGAVLPWVTGVLSTHLGSLQDALLVPVAASLVLFGMSFVSAAPVQSQDDLSTAK
jgi:fucose permease